MNRTTRNIYLASRSPRRREILSQMGVRFELILWRDSTDRARDVDEEPLAGEKAADYVQRLARHKAEAGWLRITQRRLIKLPVLAADTTVALQDEIIGKPANRDDAEKILKRLSGTTHEVHTAIAMAFENRVEVKLSTSQVTFRDLPEAVIRSYVATGEPMDKAGAYGIQGKAGLFVKHMSGSFTGIMGLPTFETAELLEQFGYPVL